MEAEKLLSAFAIGSGSCRLRRRQKNIVNAAATRATRPPTTPPAIAPAFDFVREVGKGVGRVTDEVEDGAAVELEVWEGVEVVMSEDDDCGFEMDRLASIGLNVLFDLVTFRYAQVGTTSWEGIGCRNVVTSTSEQLAAHSVQFIKLRSWQPPQALMREYVTVLHRHSVASATEGPM